MTDAHDEAREDDRATAPDEPTPSHLDAERAFEEVAEETHDDLTSPQAPATGKE